MGCAFSSVAASTTNIPTEKPLRIKIPNDLSQKEVKICPARNLKALEERNYGSYFKD